MLVSKHKLDPFSESATSLWLWLDCLHQFQLPRETAPYSYFPTLSNGYYSSLLIPWHACISGPLLADSDLDLQYPARRIRLGRIIESPHIAAKSWQGIRIVTPWSISGRNLWCILQFPTSSQLTYDKHSTGILDTLLAAFRDFLLVESCLPIFHVHELPTVYM